MIKKIMKHRKDTIRTAMVTYGPILRWSIFSVPYHYTTNPTRSNQIRYAGLLHKISIAASLAHHGLLSYLEIMTLVRAMESKVEIVEFGLYGGDGATLDVAALTQ